MSQSASLSTSSSMRTLSPVPEKSGSSLRPCSSMADGSPSIFPIDTSTISAGQHEWILRPALLLGPMVRAGLHRIRLRTSMRTDPRPSAAHSVRGT